MDLGITARRKTRCPGCRGRSSGGAGPVDGTAADRVPAEGDRHSDAPVQIQAGDRDRAAPGVERGHLVIGPVVEAIVESLDRLPDACHAEGSHDGATAGFRGVRPAGRQIHVAGRGPAGDEWVGGLARRRADRDERRDRESAEGQLAAKDGGDHRQPPQMQ